MNVPFALDDVPTTLAHPSGAKCPALRVRVNPYRPPFVAGRVRSIEYFEDGAVRRIEYCDGECIIYGYPAEGLTILPNGPVAIELHT